VRRVHDSSNGGFWKGFLSAILLFVAIATSFHVAEWLATGQFPEAVIEFLMAPRFSIVGVLTGIGVLFTVYGFAWMATVGPRMR
jgi:hypothetical protein